LKATQSAIIFISAFNKADVIMKMYEII